MANYSLVNGSDPVRGVFAYRITRPLWLHGNIPRTPEDGVYVVELAFDINESLQDFLAFYAPTEGDILEVFKLDRRVLLLGVQITVEAIADVRLMPVTNSGVPFDQVDCSKRGSVTYMVNGGGLDSATKISEHSVLLEEPDYFGFRISAGASNLQYLRMQAQLIVRDEFDPFAVSNSSKYGNQQWLL